MLGWSINVGGEVACFSWAAAPAYAAVDCFASAPALSSDRITWKGTKKVFAYIDYY